MSSAPQSQALRHTIRLTQGNFTDDQDRREIRKKPFKLCPQASGPGPNLPDGKIGK